MDHGGGVDAAGKSEGIIWKDHQGNDAAGTSEDIIMFSPVDDITGILFSLW